MSGPPLLIDSKPLSNLLHRVATGTLLDEDQRWYPNTYERLAELTTANTQRLVSTHAVATEALHFLLQGRTSPPLFESLKNSPIRLLPGCENDLNRFGSEACADPGFADFTLIWAWDSLARQESSRPYPITVTTDHALKGVATSRFSQNVYTMEDLESYPGLI